MKFIFSGYSADLKEGKVEFQYRLERESEVLEFVEKLSFAPTVETIPQEILTPVLDSIHLILGISYWKLYCPSEIELKTIQLSENQAQFWNTIYTKGLGEFYFMNKIDFQELVSFPYAEGKEVASGSLERKNRSLVGIGGGKDSIVAAELLKKAGKDFTGFMLNSHSIQKNIVDILGIEAISMKRELDSQLFELNKRKDTFNGHVPISSIYGFMAVFAALLYDYRYIIVSNEKSANYGNVEYLGMVVNHQWSKSVEFENLFQKYISDFITPDIFYFSLLRPFYELKIVEIFSKYPKYFDSFSSCNTNFRIGSKNSSLWCGKCAKCAFAFGLLASFLQKDTVAKIFGSNLYNDGSAVDTFRELLGIKDIKPFDCVGTPDEVKIAFCRAHDKGEYKEDVAMKMFEQEVLPGITNRENLESNLLNISSFSGIPAEFEEVLLQL